MLVELVVNITCIIWSNRNMQNPGGEEGSLVLSCDLRILQMLSAAFNSFTLSCV